MNREKKREECSIANSVVQRPRGENEGGRLRVLMNGTKYAAEKRRGEGINPHMGDGEYC